VKTEAAPAEAADPCVTSRAALARIFTLTITIFAATFRFFSGKTPA
jgi:hypothetical protein